MTRLLSLLLLGAWIASPSTAQTSSAQTSDAIPLLAAHAGDWEGDGWVVATAGERQTFTTQVSVRTVLGGSALVMEGSGSDHAMLSVLTYDAEADTYAVQAFAADGRPMNADAEWVDGQLVWTYTDIQDRKRRWTERFSDDGTWVRTGEVSPDGGERWIPVSEITLRRAGA